MDHVEQAVTALENAERRKYKWTRLLLPLLSYKVYLLALVYLTFQLLPSIFATEIYYENFHRQMERGQVAYNRHSVFVADHLFDQAYQQLLGRLIT